MVFHVNAEDSGLGVSPGSSRGYESGAAASLDVLEKTFCSFLDVSWSTCVEICLELALYPSSHAVLISLSHSPYEIPGERFSLIGQLRA